MEISVCHFGENSQYLREVRTTESMAVGLWDPHHIDPTIQLVPDACCTTLRRYGIIAWLVG